MHAHPPPWSIYFGLETELGITVMEDPEADVVEESIALVRSAAQHGVANLWDYATEDPHRDARGFRVQELTQDTDEANYYSQDAQRELTFQEIKSDLVLRNGARFYNDHAHPEYSTPECGTLVDLISQDKAGERLLEECARQVTRRGSRTVKLYKNNTDFRGHSYGCHDNYLIPRVIPWDRLVLAMTPFLVTRQLYAGAGKVGWECENAPGTGGFQISQRADFFSELVSIDTMNRRPLINTRDEPHADPQRFRRFHVIVGDSNLSQFATWLKIGSTALMLESLECEDPPAWWSLADPLEAHRQISRDHSFQWRIALANGKTIRAVDLQYEFIRWVEKRANLDHPEKRQVMADWKETMWALENRPLTLHDRLDWAAKRQLLDAFREQEKLEWDSPWLQSLDLEYHLLKHDEGLFYALEASGQMKRLIGEAEIIHAVQHPPSSSRAYLRGRSVLKFAREMKTAQWDNLVFKVGDQMYRLDMSQAFPGMRLEEMIAAMDRSKTIQDLIRELDLKPV
ncbi:MAG TPA: proteasome accessory factor PafA2 family protein [Candidatus Methylacidiphilales bacterium]|nr:proteasome accessory factor PafA2 family protein [Candidatus Methylacidiphilales bacterium]